ncbi:MAG: hypothetical protein ABNH26_14720 [Celeribacter sp.]|jgi:hypothetical protein
MEHAPLIPFLLLLALVITAAGLTVAAVSQLGPAALPALLGGALGLSLVLRLVWQRGR